MSRLTVLAVIAIATAVTPIGLAQTEIPMSTEKGNITVIYDGFDRESAFPGGGTVRLKASIRNDTPFKFQSVMFELNAYDEEGNDLRECFIGQTGRGGCRFTLFGPIEAGETLPLTSPGDVANIQTSQQAARIALKVIEAPYFIKYDVRSDPVVNEKFAISPSFGSKGIGLAFRNNSSDVIEVAWDQSVYIDEDGNSSRLIRGNVNLAEKDRPQPNTVIPPGTKVQETVSPIDRIQQEDGKLVQLPMVPDVAYLFDPQFVNELKPKAPWVQHAYLPGAKHLAGKEVRLFLRLLVNDQKQNVTLTFKIANMIQ
jgi:hypothetical protein